MHEYPQDDFDYENLKDDEVEVVHSGQWFCNPTQSPSYLQSI
jgi:hypothetical protein